MENAPQLPWTMPLPHASMPSTQEDNIVVTNLELVQQYCLSTAYLFENWVEEIY